VYASMGNVAASGGYYVAMVADKIFANSGTLTGSIGVISVHPNYSELNDLLDVRRDVIKTGKYMDALDQNAPTTTEDVKMATEFQDKYYQIFTDKLKKYRHLTDAEVEQVAQGQVILGEEAQRLKIVDELGNFYVAVDHLAKTVNVSKPELVFYRKDQSFLQSFLDHGIQSAKLMIGL
ncbi:S49 family peptidase, partial [bacterium]|nr:S49 family peptidase [bacterium]